MLGRPITTQLTAKLQYPQMLYACCLAYGQAIYASTTPCQFCCQCYICCELKLGDLLYCLQAYKGCAVNCKVPV